MFEEKAQRIHTLCEDTVVPSTILVPIRASRTGTSAITDDTERSRVFQRKSIVYVLQQDCGCSSDKANRPAILLARIQQRRSYLAYSL
jgi:hypothetical protein